MHNISLVLRRILDEQNSTQRNKLIEEFQNSIWIENKFDENEPLYDILNELAYDLEFYEHNPNPQDKSSYGDERLEKEIEKTLKKIEKL